MSKCPKCGSDVKPHVVGGNSDRVRKREGVSEAMKRITDKMRLDFLAVEQIMIPFVEKYHLPDEGFPWTKESIRQAIDAAIRASRKGRGK
jgi:hypothetical protein